MLEKTEGSIKNGPSRDTGNIGHMTQDEDKQNKKHYTENLKISSTDFIINWGWTQVVIKSKQFLPLIKHLLCYLYSQDMFDTTIPKQTEIT